MIQNYQTLSYYVDTFCKKVDATFQCQKVWSTPHYLVLRLRLVGENCFIYIGRGRGYEGYFPRIDQPTPEMRITDTFQLFFKKYLEGQYLSFQVDKLDRIVAIKTRHATVAIFYKARELYFVLHDPIKGVYLSWSKKWIAGPMIENVFDYFNDVGREDIQKHGEVLPITNVFEIEKKFVTLFLESDSSKKTSFNLNKKKNINKDIEILKNTIELKNEFIHLDCVDDLEKITHINKLKLRVKF
jgi:hypothetical protein